MILCLLFTRIGKSSTKEVPITDELNTPSSAVGTSTDDENGATKPFKTVIALDINHKDMSDILSAIENIHAVFEKGNNMIVS